MINDFYTVACMYSIQHTGKCLHLASQLARPTSQYEKCATLLFSSQISLRTLLPFSFWVTGIAYSMYYGFLNSTCIFVSCKICISVNIKILLCFNSYSLKAPTLVFLMNTGYPMDLHKLTHLYGVLDLTKNARQIVVEVNEIKKSSYIYNDNIFLLVHI